MRSHCGCATYVVFTGTAKRPDIFTRGRMQLSEMSLRGAKQPCHEAEQMPLPDLRSTLLSHATIHAAEGEFYRDAIVRECVERGISVKRLRKRVSLNSAS